MLIAIFSDSHDHLDLMRKGIELARERGITHAVHLGDFCAPPTASIMAESELQWTCVWGNCDGDKLLLFRRTMQAGNIDFADGDFREWEIEGRKVFLTHYPEIARIAALSRQYDAAFYGHNHQLSQEVVEGCLLANPGEVCGFKTGTSSFAIYNPEDNTVEHVTISLKPQQ